MEGMLDFPVIYDQKSNLKQQAFSTESKEQY